MTRSTLLAAFIVIIGAAVLAGMATSAYSAGFSAGTSSRPNAKCDQLSAQFIAALQPANGADDLIVQRTYRQPLVNETRDAYRQACP